MWWFLHYPGEGCSSGEKSSSVSSMTRMQDRGLIEDFSILLSLGFWTFAQALKCLFYCLHFAHYGWESKSLPSLMPKVKLSRGGVELTCLPIILSEPLVEVVPWGVWAAPWSPVCTSCLRLIQLLLWSPSTLLIFLCSGGSQELSSMIFISKNNFLLLPRIPNLAAIIDMGPTDFQNGV